MQVYRKIRVELDKEKKAEQLRKKFVAWVEKEEKENRDEWSEVVICIVCMWMTGFPLIIFFLCLLDSSIVGAVVGLALLLLITKFWAWEKYKCYRYNRTVFETVKYKTSQGVDIIMEVAYGELCSSFLGENEITFALLRGEIPIEIRIPKKNHVQAYVFCRNNDCEVLRYEFQGEIIPKVNQKGAVLDMNKEVLYLPFRDFTE